MGFGGGGVSKLTAHTHNAALAGDGGDLSETLTDMNGVALYSLITDNAAAVAANTADIATNTAAIAAIGSVPTGLVAIWTGSIASIPAGWAFYADLPSSLSQNSEDSTRTLDQFRTRVGQQFNTGNLLVGESPSLVTWYLFKTGTPVGNVTAYIRNSTGTIRETSTTSIVADDLTGSEVATAFTFAGTTTLADGDMVTVEFTGTTGNTVSVMTDSTAAVTDSILRQYVSGSWADLAGQAAQFIVSWDFAYIKKT